MQGHEAQAEREAEREMKSVAAAGDMIFYSDLVESITAVPYKPQSLALARLLTKISHRTHAEGKGMLAAVVVRRDTWRPGKGFFREARKLGYREEGEDACHNAALRDVYRANRRSGG